MSKNKPTILVTICARGGSKGVKGKNLRLLAGKPLISYTIRQAIKWGKADQVVVSTDSGEIAQVAKKYGAKVPFMRPEKLATDQAAKLPVIRHALLTCERLNKKKYQVIVDLDPTSPVRTIKDIEDAYTLHQKSGATTVFSVTPARKNPYFNMVEQNKMGNAVLVKPFSKKIIRRQDAPRVYDMNASIYIYKRKYLEKSDTVSPISSSSKIYQMSEWTSIDIDKEIDFQFVEYLIMHHKIII